ncbi:PAS domain-containing sensor histidine kinase [Maribacter forsetii]|uniref:PAS domain-containing sensor histidine kinase n=1 Tax=Maribacter forsetii TaxID=444515 RepID=UPI00068BDE54|nr:PAS domain S-box protein [Maribacter forsetii]
MSHYPNKIELQERHYQIFIEQAPTAIAMLDKNMVYLAVSKCWLKDYKLDQQDVIGRCHFDVFPMIGDDWKKKTEKCLNGIVDICDETTYHGKGDSIQWILWNVKPWYNAEGEIGGLLMHTEDITERKEKALKEKKYNTILKDTSDIARIGTWEIDLLKEKVSWSSMVYEIHEAPLDYEPTIASGLTFFEDEESRNSILLALNEAQKRGTPINLTLYLTTLKGNKRWVKVIGKIERNNGVTSKILGITQDITSSKKSEKLLNVAHAELEAIFNSDSIVVITTNSEGIINRFNKGAEKLLGYDSAEMIGLQRPEVYLHKGELEQFRNDMIAEFNGGVNDENFNYRNENVNDTRQWTYKRKDGSTFPVLSTVTAVNNGYSKKEGFIAVATDISRIKEVKNELRRKNELLNYAEQITMMGNWQWDIVLDKVLCSTNLYDIFGVKAEDMSLKYDSYFNFVHPKDKDFVAKHVENALIIKRFDNLIHRIQLDDGTVKTIKLIGEIITNSKDEVTEVIGACQDITESIKAQEELRKKNDLLNFAEQISMMSNWKWDTVADKVQWSENFYTILELDEAITDLNFNSYYRFVHPEDIGIVDKHFEQVNKNKRWDSLTHRIITTSGKVKIILILGKVFTNEKNEIIEMIGTCQDITESKEAEQKILEAKNELEIFTRKLSLQNQQLADFTHITSHNLRAPVANLNSLLEIYSYAENEEERTDIFNKFSSVIDHLSSTLNTLIEALKAKVGDANEHKENIEFNVVLENTVQMLSGAILKSNAVISSDFSKLSSISYNKIYMESIFLNLIGNAIKYSAEGRTPNIQIKTEVKNEKNIITFKDNGLGIDLDKHGHKLFGLNKVFHRHPDAKGVGLYLTKTQIEAMGGTITADSEVNVGTTFTIIFN